MTCAWALTCHRCQGQTVDHLCLHAHRSSPHRAIIVNKQYYYVALSRVRTLLGLSMTELLEEDPEYYTPDTSLLVHDANLAVQTLQTRLRYAEAWGLPASEVAELKQELVVAQGLHGTLILRLAEDLQRAAYLPSVGVTPKQEKNRSFRRQPLRSDTEWAPRRHRRLLWLRRRSRLQALHPPPGGCGSASPRPHHQQHLPRHCKRPRMLECGSASPLLRQQRHQHPPRLSGRPLLLALHLPPGGYAYGSRPR